MSFDPNQPFQPPAFQPPSTPAGTPEVGQAFGVPSAPAGATGEPIAVVGSPSDRPKRSKRKAVAAGVVAVALVGAGVFAITKITGNSSAKGGAASSVEVGKQLTDSLNNEDLLGVIDLLVPNERDTFRQPFLDTVSNLKRIEVLDQGADPSKVAGLDIKLSDVSVKEDKPSADDIVNIRITADDASTVDGTKLPIGPLLIDEAFGGKVPQTQPSIGNEPVDWRLTTVKRDGRWYLSVFYTIAETARARTDSAKVPAQPVQLNGADTPEHAVDDMLQALSRSDVEGLIGLLNPREFEALQRYAPLFLKDAQKELDSQKIGVRISNTKYTVNGSGNHRSVGIDAFKITANDGNDDVVVELKDDCLTMTRANDSADLCSGGVDGALTQFGVTDNKQVKNFVGAMRDAFAGFKPTGIAVDQVDGKWYISPIGTGADFWVAVLKSLDKNKIVDVIDSTKAMINSFETGDVFNTDASSATTTTTTG